MENNNQQQEIIKVVESKRTGVWESVKQKVTGMSKKSIILLSVGALTFATIGFVAQKCMKINLRLWRTKLSDKLELQMMMTINR